VALPPASFSTRRTSGAARTTASSVSTDTPTHRSTDDPPIAGSRTARPAPAATRLNSPRTQVARPPTMI
jgi:hypothetical protein